MPTNRAAWLTAPEAYPLEVKDSPYPVCGPDDVIIENKAVAVNPVDWKMQAYDFYITNYPAIEGCDMAGRIVEVGSNIKHLKVGDRVLAHGPNIMTNNWAHGAFQLYTLASATLVCRIPDSMSFASASVLPLCISTAAQALYQKEYLNLQRPTLSPKPNGKAVLVWGGSSACGACATQLLKLSGYEVYATASKHNFEFCKSLGAKEVFDYNSESVVGDVVAVLKGKEVAGIFDTICDKSTITACCEIAIKADIENKFIAGTLPDAPDFVEETAPGIKCKDTFCPEVMNNDVGPMIYKEFFPQALEKGLILPKPEPLIVGHGLESVQAGLDRLKAGVSAAKIVIPL